jgi:hypothetical protein
MRNQLRNVIATDIPQPAPASERAPLEIDADLRRRDAWMFAPLIAAAVTLPLIAAALLGLSAWHLATQDATHGVAAKANKAPTTFASRWPEHEMPTVTR